MDCAGLAFDTANSCSGKNSPQSMPDRPWMVRWLSSARLEPYRAPCENNLEVMYELYRWNIALAQVLMADISYFEVALRNRYDEVLAEVWEGRSHWLLDDESPVRRPIMRTSGSKKLLDVNHANRRAIEQACARAKCPEDPNQIIANLMLGFWSHMTDRSRERDLWIPYLYKAWPKGMNRAEVHATLLSINKIRNRVAHNERLFNPAQDGLLPTVVDRDIARLLGSLFPDAAKRLYGDEGKSPVDLFLENNPAPVRLAV